MDQISAMHSSILHLPQYSENTFMYLTEDVTFRRFVLDLIKANNKQFISRPVAEESWALLLCRELADLEFGVSRIETGPRKHFCSMLIRRYSSRTCLLITMQTSCTDGKSTGLECGGVLGKNGRQC
jgi:hypothetical protein